VVGTFCYFWENFLEYELLVGKLLGLFHNTTGNYALTSLVLLLLSELEN